MFEKATLPSPWGEGVTLLRDGWGVGNLSKSWGIVEIFDFGNNTHAKLDFGNKLPLLLTFYVISLPKTSFGRNAIPSGTATLLSLCDIFPVREITSSVTFGDSFSSAGDGTSSVAFATSPPTEESPQGEAESKKNFFYSQKPSERAVFSSISVDKLGNPN